MATAEVSQQERTVQPRLAETEAFDAEVRTTARFAALGSWIETIGGGAAAVLGIIGLSTLATGAPMYLTAIGVLAIASAFFLHGVFAGARYSKLVRETGASRLGAMAFGTAAWGYVLAGGAGIVLGILALVSLAPAVLLPVAMIAFGSALVLSAGMPVRLSHLERAAEERRRHTGWRLTAVVAAWVQMAAGVASVSLGIIGLAGVAWLSLALIALLALGCSALITGGILGSEMVTLLRR